MFNLRRHPRRQDVPARDDLTGLRKHRLHRRTKRHQALLKDVVPCPFCLRRFGQPPRDWWGIWIRAGP